MSRKRDRSGDDAHGADERTRGRSDVGGAKRARSSRAPAPGAGGPPPVEMPFAMPDPRTIERQLAAVRRLLEAQDFATIEEANAFLQDLATTDRLSAALAPDVELTPLERAQEVIYDALDARASKRRVALARQALAISPDCADAYVLLATETTADLHEMRALLEDGVRAGERALGPELLERYAGDFWGMLETRPYMRARAMLAEVLWDLGDWRAAIAEGRELLRLNPGDNQGIRYRLLLWLLIQHDHAGVEALLEAYADEASAAWLFGRALHLWRTQGETPRAAEALRDAMRMNPHVRAYLLGSAPLPELAPQLVGMGDESEAADYVLEAGALWDLTPGALPWLERSPARARRARPSRDAR